jgi:outer membrane autotransporter protein
MNAKGWSVRPFAGVTVVSLDQRAFDETGGRISGGAAGVALHVNRRNTESAKFYSGMELKSTFSLSNGITVSPRLRGEYAYDTSAKTGLTVDFTSARGIRFDVEGARAPRNTGNLGIGLTVSPSGKNAFLDIEGAVTAGAGYSDLRGRIGFRAEW